MLVVETIAKIRRANFQDGKPIKEICRELRVSPNTVRRVIRSGATGFTYERRVQPRPRIGPWRDELDRMLAENARKPKRERQTHIRIPFSQMQPPGKCSDSCRTAPFRRVRAFSDIARHAERTAAACVQSLCRAVHRPR
jgi:hypothetical protein